VFFLRLALYTCAVYLVLTIALELVALAFVYLRGGLFIGLSVRLYGPIFAILWLISFAVGWRIFTHGFQANLRH